MSTLFFNEVSRCWWLVSLSRQGVFLNKFISCLLLLNNTKCPLFYISPFFIYQLNPVCLCICAIIVINQSNHLLCFNFLYKLVNKG